MARTALDALNHMPGNKLILLWLRQETQLPVIDTPPRALSKPDFQSFDKDFATRRSNPRLTARGPPGMELSEGQVSALRGVQAALTFRGLGCRALRRTTNGRSWSR